MASLVRRSRSEKPFRGLFVTVTLLDTNSFTSLPEKPRMKVPCTCFIENQFTVVKTALEVIWLICLPLH